MATSIVPQASPAVVVKNPDGTYAVRVQHTLEGNVTEVQFHNHVFGEALATAYAAFLNGEAKVVAEVEKIAPKAKTDLSDVRQAGEVVLAKAEADAQKIVDDTKVQVTKTIADAEVVAEGIKADAKVEAEAIIADAKKILADARVEAVKLAEVAAEKVVSLKTDVVKIAEKVTADAEVEVEKL
jgi:F0F1-type ATP synthase membrane subunit b/b'